MSHVFISYAREDQKIAQRLYHDLELLNLNLWLDEEKLIPGQDWEREIRQAIRESSHFLILISRNSVGKSGYVQAEIRYALEVLKQQPPDKIFVIPVRLDKTEPKFEALQALHRVDLFRSYAEGMKQIWRAITLSERVPPFLDSGEESRFLFELIRRGGGGKCVAVWGRSGVYRKTVFDETVRILRATPRSEVVELDLYSYRGSDVGPIGPLIWAILDLVPADLHETEEYELLRAEGAELHVAQILGMASDLLRRSLEERREAFFVFNNPEALAMGGLPILTTNDKDFLSTRVSYRLNLRGPSFSVQAACSTSLVATHLACEGLLNHECSLALAGGVTVSVPQKSG